MIERYEFERLERDVETLKENSDEMSVDMASIFHMLTDLRLRIHNIECKINLIEGGDE